MEKALLLALMGTGCSFFGTALGAAMVYFFKKDLNEKYHRIFLGFASGIMIAASFWSLLLPAMEMAQQQDMIPWLPTVGGFIAGGLFLFLLDKLIPHLHMGENKAEGPNASFKRTTLLVLAVTLHNIPEGMAVGLSFALAAMGDANATLAGATALTIGMALQNFPEGAAISLPLQKEGVSRHRAFFYGVLSGVVEPIAGIVGVLLAVSVAHNMPFMLYLAAGAMIYVVIEELVPQSYHEHSNEGTLSAMAGFVLMMLLDTLL